MEFLTRDDILKIDDIEERIIAVPEWGGKVLIRGLTGEERDGYEKSLLKGKGKNREVNMINARAKLVTATIVDNKTKKPIFSQADIETLGRKSAKALNRIFDVATELSGIGEEEIEELTKNSESVPSDSSASS